MGGPCIVFTTALLLLPLHFSGIKSKQEAAQSLLHLEITTYIFHYYFIIS